MIVIILSINFIKIDLLLILKLLDKPKLFITHLKKFFIKNINVKNKIIANISSKKIITEFCKYIFINKL